MPLYDVGACGDHGDLESDLKRKLKIEAGGAGCRWVTGDGEIPTFGGKNKCVFFSKTVHLKISILFALNH